MAASPIVRWAPRAVFVDVAAVTPLQDAGIGALVARGKAAASVAVTVVLLNPDDRLNRQLQDCRVADLLCPHSTLNAAAQPVTLG